MQLTKKFIREVEQEGLQSAISASIRFLYQRRMYFEVKQWWKYGRHYKAELDPYRIIWIDPDRIYQQNESVIAKSERNLSHVIGGEWDQTKQPFEERLLYRSMEQHFIGDVDWKQTELYEQVVEGDTYWRGISSEAEFENRCNYLDELYESIRAGGFRTQQEIHGRKPRKPGEIKVKIGRDGSFFYINGKHRLSIAKILDIGTIPVNVIIRHKNWQALRDKIVMNGSPDQIYSQNIKYKSHPDIAYLYP